MTALVQRKALTTTELERVNHLSARAAQRVSDQLAKLAILATDANGVIRRERHLCQACEYLNYGRLAGQAFTPWVCCLCKKAQSMHHNTSVPTLCTGCAEAFGLCVTCGGDVEMQHRGRKTGKRAKRIVKP